MSWKYPSPGWWNLSVSLNAMSAPGDYTLDIWTPDDWPQTWAQLQAVQRAGSAYRFQANLSPSAQYPQAPTEIRFWTSGAGFVGSVPFSSTAIYDWIPPAGTRSGVYAFRAQPYAGDVPVSNDVGPIYFDVSANRPPVANAGVGRTLECVSPSGTIVTLDGSASSDPEGDILKFQWRNSAGAVVASSANATVSLLLGTHVFYLTVDDGKGGTATAAVTVIVRDTTAPALKVALSPNVLWPAHHKLVDVHAEISVRDACDSAPRIYLMGASSNEPDDGLGDGDMPNDIQGVSTSQDDRDFQLRAERSGTGPGRTYTVFYKAVDAAGNAITQAGIVIVPHDAARQ